MPTPGREWKHNILGCRRSVLRTLANGLEHSEGVGDGILRSLGAQGSRKSVHVTVSGKSASEFAKGQRRYWNTCLGATNLKPDPRMRHSLQSYSTRYSTPGTRTHHPGADDLHCLVTGCLISFLYNMQHAGTFNRSLRRGQARLDPKH